MPVAPMRITCIEEPLRTKSRPICPRTPGETASATQAGPTTSALAKALDSAPLAASTAAVLEASAAVPAACASISRTTVSEKSPPLSRFSRLDHGYRTVTSPVARWHASIAARTATPRTRLPRKPGCWLGDHRTPQGTSNRRQSACHRRRPKPRVRPFHVNTLQAQASASASPRRRAIPRGTKTFKRSSKLTPPTKSVFSRDNGNTPRRIDCFHDRAGFKFAIEISGARPLPLARLRLENAVEQAVSYRTRPAHPPRRKQRHRSGVTKRARLRWHVRGADIALGFRPDRGVRLFGKPSGRADCGLVGYFGGRAVRKPLDKRARHGQESSRRGRVGADRLGELGGRDRYSHTRRLRFGSRPKSSARRSTAASA